MTDKDRNGSIQAHKEHASEPEFHVRIGWKDPWDRTYRSTSPSSISNASG